MFIIFVKFVVTINNFKNIFMKKINLLITLLFSVITYSQVITYTSVRLR